MSYKCKSYDKTFGDHNCLYHYTTLDSLMKIAESRMLLFNRCDKLNDIIEGSRSHVKYYVSCFTYEKKETIPMWYIYTRGINCCPRSNVGVRLCVDNGDFFTGKIYLDPKNKEECYDASEFGGIFCGKTIYDDANKDRNPTYGNIDPEKPIGIGIEFTNVPDLGLMGKGTAWAYEKEARFFTLDSQTFNVDKIFVGLEDSFFDGLRITLSPLLRDEQITNSEKIIADLFGEDRCTKSELWGTIRVN